ncbi:V-type ATP synthase subunit I [Dehalococcoidia bacterium]|nr:V-type ATP synthase subunit I [Dehalococcoidia bacterium]
MNLPLLLNTPEPMVMVRVVTTRDRSDATLKTLHEEGVLHVEQSEELKPVERAAVEGARNRVSESLKYINEILSYIPEKEKVFLKEDLTTRYLRPFDEIESDTRSLYATLTDLYKKAAGLDREIKRLREDNRYLRPLAEEIDLNLADLSFSGNYLFSRVFVLPLELHRSFLDRIRPHTLHTVVATTENEAVVYVIARVEGKKVIEDAANDLGCRMFEIAPEDLTLKHFLVIIEGRIQGLKEQLTTVTRELEAKTREHLAEVVLLKEVLSAESERLAILEKASEAKYVTMVEGWIPEANVESAMLHLKEAIDIVFVDVRAATESEEPPAKFNNLGPLRPFEVVVKLFGVPGYREWDPTPIIAYTFAIFFGLMLGDVIYGLGLILAARFILPSFTDDPESDNFKLFQRLIYTSSVIALIVGLLSGTALGDFTGRFLGIYEGDWALVGPFREVITNPVYFIVGALVIGIIHIILAHLLGFIRGARERSKGIMLSRAGSLSVIIFGIPFLLYGMMDFRVVPVGEGVYTVFGYLAAVGFVMIVVAAFVQMKGLGAIFWLLDVTGILGDIMSYARLAGVGLATFYLAYSFNMLGEMIYGALSGMLPGLLGVAIGGIATIIVLLFGHSLNLALSGLGAFIHSLRLCFVEFMFKFYEGGGRQYEPFCLKPRTFIVVG